MEIEFQTKIADSLDELTRFVDLSNELALESEDMGLPQVAIDKTANFLIQHAKYAVVILAIHTKSQELMGTLMVNFEFGVERNRDTVGFNSFFVSKKYRKRGVGRRIMNHFYDEMRSRQIIDFWFYVERDNLNAIQVYKHFGIGMFPQLQIYNMDFVLREDPETKQTLSVLSNIEYYAGKLLKVRKGLGASEISASSTYKARILESKDVDQLEEQITGKLMKYGNVLNEKWKNLNLEGLRTLTDPKHCHKGYSIAVIRENEIVGVVTTLRDFSDWRAGFAVWFTGLFLRSDCVEEHQIHYVCNAIQDFCVDRITNISYDPKSARSMLFSLLYVHINFI